MPRPDYHYVPVPDPHALPFRSFFQPVARDPFAGSQVFPPPRPGDVKKHPPAYYPVPGGEYPVRLGAGAAEFLWMMCASESQCVAHWVGITMTSSALLVSFSSPPSQSAEYAPIMASPPSLVIRSIGLNLPKSPRCGPLLSSGMASENVLPDLISLRAERTVWGVM